MYGIRHSLATLTAILLMAASARAADDTKRFQGLDGTIFLGTASSFNTEDKSGFYFGLRAGLRYQFDNDLVVGVAGDAGGIDVFDGIWSVTGLVGRAFGRDRRHLVYGDVGFARADVFCLACTDEKTRASGVRIGSGYEYALSPHFRLRAQVFYSVLSSFDDPVVAAVGIGFQF